MAKIELFEKHAQKYEDWFVRSYSEGSFVVVKAIK